MPGGYKGKIFVFRTALYPESVTPSESERISDVLLGEAAIVIVKHAGSEGRFS